MSNHEVTKNTKDGLEEPMRPGARNIQRLDPMAISIITGILGVIVFLSLKMFVSKPLAGGITVFVGVIVHASLGGLFQVRAWRVYAKVLVLSLQTSFLAGYVVFLFDLD
jgi:hypothetical protein